MIFKGIRGLIGIFSVYARWKISFCFLTVVLVCFAFFLRMLALLTHHTFKLLGLSGVLLHYKPIFSYEVVFREVEVYYSGFSLVNAGFAWVFFPWKNNLVSIVSIVASSSG